MTLHVLFGEPGGPSKKRDRTFEEATRPRGQRYALTTGCFVSRVPSANNSTPVVPAVRHRIDRPWPGPGAIDCAGWCADPRHRAARSTPRAGLLIHLMPGA